MKKSIFYALCGLSLLISTTTSAQFGKLKDKIKEKAEQLMESEPKNLLNSSEELIKKELVKKTDAKQASFDTSSFIYTIAFLDKTESFENQQENEKLFKAANFLLTSEEDQTEQDQARSLYELGRYNYLKRSYRLAEFNLNAARDAYIALSLESDPVYLKTLGTLCLLYNDMGRFDQALKMAEQTAGSWKEEYGAGSKGYLSAMHNRAVILMNLGQFSAAEKSFLNLRDQIQHSEGEHSMPTAILHNNLAILYLKLGRMEAAAEMIQKTISIADQALKEKSGTYIQLLTNQALIYQQNHSYDKAEQTYLKAKDLQESRLKLNRTSDPDYAHLLSNMAALYMYKNDLGKAENYLKESLEIQVNKYGAVFPEVAAIQYELGNLYLLKKDWTSAKSNYNTAYASRVKLFGESHPTTIQSLYGLSVAEWYTGDVGLAKQHLETVLDVSLGFANDFFGSMSEVEKTSYWDQIQPYFLTYYNFAAKAKVPSDYLSKLFQYRTATKGILLSSTTKLKSTIQLSNDPKLISLYQQWVDQKKSLAVYYSLSRKELQNQRINLDSLEEAANQTERTLSERSGLFNASMSQQLSVSVEDIQAKLKAGESLVEIIQYPILDGFLSKESGYMAVVIQPNKSAQLVILPEGNELDSRNYASYKNLIRLKVTDKSSYEKFWQPIDQLLSENADVYLSTDGIYHQVNISTLLIPDAGYVVDKYTIHLLGHPRHLLEEEQRSRPMQNAFLLGYPDYGTDNIASLPGTDAEVNAIGAVLKRSGINYDIKERLQATESSVKAQQSPSIFHIATHGFFLEDVGGGSGEVFGVRIDEANKNPLLRSGLLLAGAGSEQSSNTASFEDNDNGVLNAFEAVNLDLSNTQMVVLSACETGKGDMKSGEGVYGLQRAFRIAGAEQLMMSLWKVDDNATKELMINFYDNWIEKHMSPVKAFRAAQLAVKAKFPEPYYWGAFVMVE